MSPSSSKRLAKSYFSNYVTAYDIKQAEAMIHGLLSVYSEYDYVVISVVRESGTEDMSFLHDEKHLVMEHTDTDTFVAVTFEDLVDSGEAKDYLPGEKFARLLAARIKFDPSFLTMVSVAGFHGTHDSAWDAIGGKIESQHSWTVEEFAALSPSVSGRLPVLPPNFYLMDIFDEESGQDEVALVDLNDEDSAELSFEPEFGANGDDIQAIAGFLSEAGDGYHNVFALWQEPDGTFVGDNAVIRAENGDYSVQAESTITRGYKYSLFSRNIAIRLNEGMGTFLVVQTFPLESGDENSDLEGVIYEARGWDIEGEMIRGLEEQIIREVVALADFGDVEMKHARFMESNDLNLDFSR